MSREVWIAVAIIVGVQVITSGLNWTIRYSMTQIMGMLVAIETDLTAILSELRKRA